MIMHVISYIALAGAIKKQKSFFGFIRNTTPSLGANFASSQIWGNKPHLFR